MQIMRMSTLFSLAVSYHKLVAMSPTDFLGYVLISTIEDGRKIGL